MFLAANYVHMEENNTFASNFFNYKLDRILPNSSKL